MPIAVGVADDQWRIIEVSADIQDIAGCTPEQCIGTDLLALFRQSDVSEIPRGPAVAQLRALSLRHVQMAHQDGRWLEISLLIAPFNPAREQSVFAIVGRPKRPADVTADRVASLEMHLRRIGSEVRAAGVLEAFEGLRTASQHPQLRELTTRQWEILNLLLEGQRVSTIADTLFISQSTVRNHLATIFKKFGVHSQAELLELLKPAAQPRFLTMDDVEAIKQLKARYCRLMDTKDWVAFRQLFTDDVEMDTTASGGTVVTGADAFLEFLVDAIGDVRHSPPVPHP